jgi:hypothetical protein
MTTTKNTGDRSKQSASGLRVNAVKVNRAATAAEMARGAPPRLNLAVEVDNPGPTPLHAWSSMRGYDYDESTHTLTVHLSDASRPEVPGFRIISHHPRPPVQVEVSPGGKGTLEVSIPGSVRRLTPGRGLGQSFEEVPIGQVDRVDINVQHATEPIAARSGESADQFQERLRTHGVVARVSVKPTAQ